VWGRVASAQEPRSDVSFRVACARYRQVEICCISIYRIEGNKITELWSVEDQFGLMRQIGAVAESEQ
jgi:predicted ester cyclase